MSAAFKWRQGKARNVNDSADVAEDQSWGRGRSLVSDSRSSPSAGERAGTRCATAVDVLGAASRSNSPLNHSEVLSV